MRWEEEGIFEGCAEAVDNIKKVVSKFWFQLKAAIRFPEYVATLDFGFVGLSYHLELVAKCILFAKQNKQFYIQKQGGQTEHALSGFLKSANVS